MRPIVWLRASGRAASAVPLRGRRFPALFTAALAAPLLVGGQAAPTAASASAAAPSFTFNWLGQPPAPQPWVPASTSDWDVLVTNGDPTDQVVGGSFQAGHGADCRPPPATHPVSQLADTVYICKDHMMTANNNSNTFFTPNQLVDFSRSTATVTFQVSTARLSTRDWWGLWLMPYNENYATPTDNAPAFNGNPDNALHITMDQRGGCSLGQPTWPPDQNSGAHGGSMFRFELYRGGNSVQKGGGGDCMEDAAGGASATSRPTFELNVSQRHIRFVLHGAAREANFIDDDLSLPFNQAVVTWEHRSYDPSKACGFDGSCGPNTFHWSNFSISPSMPFTMLRPNGVASIHEGTASTVTLPQPAPANAFLRLAAFGNIRVSYDGGAFTSPHMQDTAWRPESASNYFTPIPAGTKTISFQGSSRGGQRWWVEDVAVWAATPPVSVPVRANPPPPPQAPAEAPAQVPAEAPAQLPVTQKIPARKSRPVYHPWPTDLVAGPYWSAIHHIREWSGRAVQACLLGWSRLTGR